MSKKVRIILSFASLASLLVPVAASEYAITTPYWCGSYYSSVPCSGYGYASSGNYNYNWYGQYPQLYSYPYYQNYGYTHPVPSCTITISTPYNYNNYYGYSSYGQPGSYNQTVTLSWTSINATSAYLSSAGSSVATQGSMSVYAYGNTTYMLTVSGPGGSNTCQTVYYQPTYSQPTYYQPSYYQQQQYYYYPNTNYQYQYWWGY